MATSLYFAPSYFAPLFFGPTGTPGGVAPDPAPGPPEAYGDGDAYEALIALLEGTMAFDSVLFGVPLDGRAPASAGTPLASLVPVGWEESDEFDPVAILRRVGFSLWLLVRDDDPSARADRLGRLESAARAAIRGSGLGGCLPALTWLRRGGYDASSLHPEQAVRLDGEFSYMIEPA